MTEEQGLSPKELKNICDLIGKKGTDGKPITVKEIKQWSSVKK